MLEQGASSGELLGKSPHLDPCKHAKLCICLMVLGLYLNQVLIQGLSSPGDAHLREISNILLKAQSI